MNVLSLFDGMSCGQQALERAGFKVDNYFASEIDKYAIQVTMANYPNTKQLGSVVNVDGYKLPKIDLLIGGSPCQSFSFAGKRKGMATTDEQEILTLEHYLKLKAEGYEFEGQSYLFWEYMRLLNEVKPKYFLLENVEMGEKWEKVLSKAIGVNGIHINSALVSAQNRKRIYWTNIGLEPSGLFGYLESIITQPKDKGILLKDVLQDNPNSIYYLSDKMVNYVSKSGTKNFYYKPEFANLEDKAKPIVTKHIYRAGTTNYIKVDEKYFLSEKMIAGFERHKERHNEKGTGFGYVPKNQDDKGNSLRANAALCPTDNMLIVHNTMPRSGDPKKGGTGHLSRNDGKTYCLDTGNTNAVEVRGIIQHIIPEIVSVRKYEVNILSLQDCLKQHKKLNNKEIADALNVPKTMVEHWFRTDTYFSIPDKDIWLKLKKLLKISTNEFDKSILIFEEKESVFEKTNRVYDENGIAPTLTSTSADERILVREVKVIATQIGNSENYGNSINDKGKSFTLRKSEPNGVILNSRIRRLTPIECERLQTVKDNYTNYVSDSQRYKMLGNGWTIDVISHIFSFIVQKSSYKNSQQN